MRSAATLRAEIEGALESRIPSALTPRRKVEQETISCGINAIDLLEAFRRGTLVEICGLPSSGRTTVLHGLLSRCTNSGEAAAVIDVTDSFDPVSASRVGVVLTELLWVRCGVPQSYGRKLSAVEQGIVAATDLVQGGGFGMLVLDMANVSIQEARKIPLSKWFQLRRAVEGTRTLFVVLVQQSNAGSSSASVVDLSQAGVEVEESRPSRFTHIDGDCVIRSLSSRAEVVRGQMRKPVQSVRRTGEFSTALHSYR